MHSIDARGMSCPQPALLTKQAIAQDKKDLHVLVDSNCAKNNVMRLLESNQYVKLTVSEDQEGIHIRCSK